DINNPVKLEEGQNFSVVINFTDPDYTNLIAIEYPYEQYSSKATANAGEGYISSNGNSWADITNIYENTSICIKAFTDDPQVASILVDPVNETTYAGENLQFNYETFDQGNYSIDADVVWSSLNESVGTIDSSGIFTAHAAGNTTVSVNNGSVTNSTNITVLERPVFSITVDEPQEGYNYSTNLISLNVSANLDVAIWTYDINSTGTHPFNPNTTLTIPDGNHNITVLAKDTMGNMASEIVNFSIDTTAPTVIIEQPLNTTYGSNIVNLNVSADENVNTWTYNVDNSGKHSFVPNITLDLPDGDHQITVFANDTVGNIGSETVNFSVDATAPTVTIENPLNIAYTTDEINLNVSADENVNTWIYNIDNTGNHSFIPNITLSSPEGRHNITVFAKDKAGNWGSSNTDFTIDLPCSRKSSSSSVGGGGSGNTGESFDNIVLKEVKTIFVNKGAKISYHFKEEYNKIDYVEFYSLKNSGKISTTIEVLKEKSTFVSENPPEIVYQQMNIWVGKAGFASSSLKSWPVNSENIDLRIENEDFVAGYNIAEPIIGFRVSKSWMDENEIDRHTIKLYRNHDEEWTGLTTTILDEDQEYIYFEAKTPGFSPFAISGSKESAESPEISSKLTETNTKPISSSSISSLESNIDTNSESSSENTSLPMVSKTILITIFGCAYLVLRKRI
ncbi:MAG: PGF-pre-PGF domain-containing protein, partial [Halobacteriota archaeon]